MRGLEKIYGEGTDRHTDRHTHTHFNTVNRPGLRAGSIEKHFSLFSAQTVSASKGPIPGRVAQCRQRATRPDPSLVNYESFIASSRSLIL